MPARISQDLNASNILSENGLLSQVLPGFTPRESQIKMAESIEQALALDAQLIIEAGTGTGKTFGYLIPIFLSQKKTIISTGTKTLQDQLFFNDIPKIKTLLEFKSRVALLKGRANYLCHYRLDKNNLDGRFSSRALVNALYEVTQWAKITTTGDIAEIDFIAEDSAIWPYVTSTTENCLNKDCPFIKECFLFKARKEALEADVVVVNHHLFFADLILQEEGFGELLPGANAVIFDEAHHLPDIVSHFFSVSLTGRQLTELARDIESELDSCIADNEALIISTRNLQQATASMRLALGEETRRAMWPISPDKILVEVIAMISTLLSTIEAQLKPLAVQNAGLESCWRRILQLIERFKLLTHHNTEDKIHWFETFIQNFALQLTPLVVSEQFKPHLAEKKRTWIFTSATLTVKNSFSTFVEALGLDKAIKLQLKSPFDYTTQSLLYVPRGLPDPNHITYIDSVIETIIPILQANQGKAFILFTSHRAMEYTFNSIKDALPFPFLVQGSMPKKKLIQQFKTLSNPVLLGTSSFWYGVDVQGDALSCVIIDKLPFSAPEDPILQARIKLLVKKGYDPFQHYQLPQAVLALKQGAGRLIRDYKDRGILMICDPRLVASRYGAAFLESLPPMPRTRDLNRVKEFIYETTRN